MIGHRDETIYLTASGDLDEMQEDKPIEAGQHFKKLKWYIFDLFFQLNANKFLFGLQYYVIILVIEGLQLMSLLLNDGEHNDLGPYGGDTPWKLSQTQWLIDLCWIFRIDRYFKGNISAFIAMFWVWNFLLLVTVWLGAVLCSNISHKMIKDSIQQTMKVLISLQTSILFIPIVDTYAFWIRCTVEESHESCLDIPQNSGYAVLYTFLLLIFLCEIALISLMYYDNCYVCGGLVSKPHPRLKLLKFVLYTIVVFSFYFINVTGKETLYLVVSLAVGMTGSYFNCQFFSYYNMKISTVRLSTYVAFTCGVFAMLMGKVFASTGHTESSVSLLFYFLTPCMIQIMFLAMLRRKKVLRLRKVEDLNSIYQVELKTRAMLQNLDSDRFKKEKREKPTKQEFETEEVSPEDIINEVEETFNEAVLKFPDSPFLMLWSGLFQCHFRGNFILSIIQCYKGLAMSSKIDSSFALFYFRRKAETLFKNKTKDEAHQFVQWEKFRDVAKRNDIQSTEAQLQFWMELESKHPKMKKLVKITNEMMTVIEKTKSNYNKLLKINNKDIDIMRMYGGFLSTLSDTMDSGVNFIHKAEAQEKKNTEKEANQKQNPVTDVNDVVLSYFDKENAIIYVSGDLENLGEIEDLNPSGTTLFGYQTIEIQGRKVSTLIARPFADDHDNMMKKYHQHGHYSIISQNSTDKAHVLYFTHKQGYIFEARLLVKVVPKVNTPPYLMAIVKPTVPSYDYFIMDLDYVICGVSRRMHRDFITHNIKLEGTVLKDLFIDYESIKDSLEAGTQFMGNMILEHLVKIHSSFQRETISIGSKSAYVLKFNFIAPPSIDKTTNSEQGEQAPTEILDLGDGPTVKSESVDRNTVSSLSNSVLRKPGERSPKDNSTGSQLGSPDKESEMAYSSNDSDAEYSDSDSSYSNDSETESNQEGSIQDPSSRRAKQEDLNILSKEGSKSQKHSSRKQTSFDDQNEIMEISDEERLIDAGSRSRSESESERKDDAIVEQKAPISQTSRSSGSQGASSSSATSNKSFSKSVKALVAYQCDLITAQVRWFKIALMITIVILVVTSVISFEIIEDSIESHENYDTFINYVGDLRFFTVSLAYYGRILQLMDHGIIADQNRAEIISWVQEDSNNMHKSSNELYKNLDILDGNKADIFRDEVIQNWFYEAGFIRDDRVNLFDAASNIVLNGYMLGQTHESERVELNNRRVWYLLRNGSGETLRHMNESASLYVETSEDRLVDERVTAILIINGSIVLLFTFAAIAALPCVIKIERSKAEVWSIFFDLPKRATSLLRNKCTERLNLIADMQFETDVNQSVEDVIASNEEQYSGEIRPKKDSGNDYTAILSQSVVGDSESMSKRPDTEKNEEEKEKEDKEKADKKKKKTKPYDPILRRWIIVKLLIFFIVTCVYFYMIFYTGFETVVDIIEEQPVKVNWSGRRRMLVREVNHWILETLFSNQTDIGYKYVIFENQSVGSPYLHTEMLINELEHVEHSLTFGNNGEGIHIDEDILSNEHKDLIFSDACDIERDRQKDNWEDIGDKAMTQGTHSALKLYVQTARHILLTIQDASNAGELSLGQAIDYYENDPDMQLIRDLDNYYLYDPLKRITELQEEDYSDKVGELDIWHDVMLALYVIFTVAILILLYLPMINKLGQDAYNAWNLLKLIPQEQFDGCAQLVQIVRERRDNFKWR